MFPSAVQAIAAALAIQELTSVQQQRPSFTCGSTTAPAVILQTEASPTSANAQPTGPSATVNAGVIIGTTTVVTTSPTSSVVTVDKYLGVPFAISPPKRFMPPEPLDKFAEPLVAQAWKPACMQQFTNATAAKQEFSIAVFGGHPTPVECEDCLYLNVYVPETATPNKTVMFWIFGGGLKFGHAGQDLYDGSSLAANQDVIVVTINYRTNVFGFPNAPALDLGQRNVGYLDQRLALQWTHDNIAAFGGDPAKVTIFGQSAGAKSVDRLILLPPDPIPFRGAILQSDVASWGADPDPDKSADAWRLLVRAVNCTDADTDIGLECVSGIDPFVIKSIIENGFQGHSFDFGAVVDGITRPFTPLARNQTVPMMIGSTGQESRVFAVGLHDLNSYIDATFANYQPGFRRNLATTYSAGFATGYDSISQLETDQNFQCPIAFAAANSTSLHLPTWRYLFNASFPNTNFDNALKQYDHPDVNMRAFHTSDIAYVFGTIPTDSTQIQYALSQHMQTAWANFAKDPTAGPGWNSSDKGLMVLGQPLSDASGLVQASDVDERCALWRKVVTGSR